MEKTYRGFFMDIRDKGLVLEGGGLRGVYTSGVLHHFMEKKLDFPYVIGVSMGACNAANYVSRQSGRNKIVNISFVNDRRYLSYFRLLTKGELFGMKFIFDTIPNKLVPFDFETFYKNKIKCVVVVTDCDTGEARYFDKHELGEDYITVLQASSSLPFVAKPVMYKGRVLMDGGMTDSIPIRRSITDGNKKNVIILTQPKGYRKKPETIVKIAGLCYRRYKGLRSALRNRHERYNETMDFIDDLEKKGEAFIIRPESVLKAKRVERNQKVLNAVYERGYADAVALHDRLVRFLES
jgi:predicted patatin/cPLA2 family phospholipase